MPRSDVFTLKCDYLKNASFVGFRGKEQISQPYEIEFFFTVPVGTSVKGAVGGRATIQADRDDGRPPVVFHGVVAAVRLLHQVAERALYRALLVPKLWQLRHFWRSYVFTGMKIDAFLGETLKAGGLTAAEFRFSIDSGSYPDEEFVAQYRETHLDFFHRWLEREGLYYYFEHKADAASEVLVIVDHLGQHEDFPGGGRVDYVPLVGDDVTAPAGLHHLEADVCWLPKSVTIADYDYANPSASLKGESAVTQTGVGAIQEYGYRVFVEKEAKRLAEVRAQAIGCRETTLRAEGDAIGPRPGYRVGIDDRPEDLDEQWLAVTVEHGGAISGMTQEVARLTGLSTRHTYEMKMFAIPSDVQYRAPQTTAWPRIYGFENGIVCGSADSHYAQLDNDGRYLVRFEFDTSDLPDGKASTRVRMLQPHGGSNEGFHFPLRKGTEVMIAFLGGDPDRPFIAGVVPNAHKPSVVGARNHTQNVIRTGSNNQIVMEDDQGKEFIFLSSPNNATGFYMGNPAGARLRCEARARGLLRGGSRRGRVGRRRFARRQPREMRVPQSQPFGDLLHRREARASDFRGVLARRCGLLGREPREVELHHLQWRASPLSNGDNAGVAMGVASGLVMGPQRNLTGAFTVIRGCAPMTRLTSVSLQNSTNAPGATIVPSVTTVLVLAP